MTAESKKLRTTLDMIESNRCLLHDARIAHEQREVIRRQHLAIVDALNNLPKGADECRELLKRTLEASSLFLED